MIDNDLRINEITLFSMHPEVSFLQVVFAVVLREQKAVALDGLPGIRRHARVHALKIFGVVTTTCAETSDFRHLFNIQGAVAAAGGNSSRVKPVLPHDTIPPQDISPQACGGTLFLLVEVLMRKWLQQCVIHGSLRFRAHSLETQNELFVFVVLNVFQDARCICAQHDPLG